MSGSARREYVLTLAAGAVGAGLVLLSVRQEWARVVTAAVSPLPSSSVPVSGQDLLPVAGALGLVSLAGLGALIATRGLARRLTGVVLALFGVATAAGACLRLSAAAAVAAARGAAVSGAASATAGGSGGVSPGTVPGGGGPALSQSAHVVMMTFPWRGLAVAGAVLILAAGAAAAWRGGTWPTMSSRYDRQARREPAGTDTASLWEALSSGVDPTQRRPR
jgi:uncharacterized membrane protein (TIGR02234 family)